MFDVTEFGALQGGDDSLAIQAAIDAAQDASGNPTWGGYPDVYFPPGVYSLRTPVVWKSASLRGDTLGTGVSLVWDGEPGATVITRWGEPHAGKLSYAQMSGLRFASGEAQPATWLDLTTHIIDKYCTLDTVHFDRWCTGDAIKVDTWVNLHWRNLRFDGVMGYCIAAKPSGTLPYGGSLQAASFLVDTFTVDNKNSTNAGKPSGPGFLLIDNTETNANNLGVVKLANFRAEPNSPWSAPAGFVTYRNRHKTPWARALRVVLDDFTYITATGVKHQDSLLHRDMGGDTSTSGEELMVKGARFNGGTPQLISGDWSPYLGRPAWDANTRNVGYLAFNCGPGADLMGSTLRTFPSLDQTAWTVRSAGASRDHFQVGARGEHRWGNGINTPDVELLRPERDTLALGKGDSLSVDGTWDGGTLRLGNWRLWVDSTGRLRMKSSPPTSDTDGNVIGG